MGADQDNLWWYNHKTGQVEKGRQSPSIHRDGPYPTKEDAERAPEIWRQRSEQWAADEKNGDD